MVLTMVRWQANVNQKMIDGKSRSTVSDTRGKISGTSHGVQIRQNKTVRRTGNRLTKGSGEFE